MTATYVSIASVPTSESFNPAKCVDCERPMRPRLSRIEDYPGLVGPGSHGKCYTCYHKTRTTGGRHSDRPTNDPVAELVRFVPSGGHQLVKGRVVSVNPDRYVLLVNGHKLTYDRNEWLEVIE